MAEEIQDIKSNPSRSLGIKYGIITGIASVALMMLTFGIDRRLFLTAGTFTTIFYIIWMVIATRKAKLAIPQEQHTMNMLLQTPFLVYLIANIIYFVLVIVVFNIVDPNLGESTKGFMLQLLDKIKTLPNNEQNYSQIEAMKTMVAETTPSYTIKTTAMEFSFSLFKGFLISSIIVFFMTIRRTNKTNNGA